MLDMTIYNLLLKLHPQYVTDYAETGEAWLIIVVFAFSEAEKYSGANTSCNYPD